MSMYCFGERIEQQLDDHQTEEQHGFRRGKRIAEHLMTANAFLGKTLAVGTLVWVVILDLNVSIGQHFGKACMNKTSQNTWFG